MNMNKMKLIGVAALALATGGAAKAQTNAPTNVSTNVPNLMTNTIAGGLTEIWNAIESSGLATATNYAVEPYLTYAPDAKAQFGGGAFLAYNVSHYIGTGLGFDYLGQFSLVSADIQLKVPTHPLAGAGWAPSWATNVAVCPFALAGVGKALSGGADGAIAVTDAGAYVGFGHLWGGQFNTGFAYGRWDNAGDYSGPRYHIFAGWSKGF